MAHYCIDRYYDHVNRPNLSLWFHALASSVTNRAGNEWLIRMLR